MNDDNKYHVRTIASVDDLYSLRPFWEKWQQHPNADFDYYLGTILTRKEVLRPHVVVLYCSDDPLALYAGRLEEVRIGVKLGYGVFCRPRVRSLSLIYGGLMGHLESQHCRLLVSGLIDSLRRRDADIVQLVNLQTGSEIWRFCKAIPPFLSRDCLQPENIHWRATLKDSYDDFLKARSKNTRRNLRRYSQEFEEKYAGRMSIRVYRSELELEALFQGCCEIAAKTYQRSLGAGFADDEMTRQRMLVAARKGWLRGCVLFVQEKPVAFWNGVKYGRTLYTDTTGYDPAYSDDHVGTYLLAKMMQNCYQEDIQNVDFGFGDAQYKRDLCDTSWMEANVFMYALTTKGLAVKGLKTLEAFFLVCARAVLSRGDLYLKLKRTWRKRLARHEAQV